MTDSITTTCCVVGGGPAGMMLGLLLARAGVSVTVLEKHPDFFRDFRGDTIHPSTLRVMDELGLLEKFLKVPHRKALEINGYFGNEEVGIADFSGFPAKYAFVAFMPQWDFLDFLLAEASQYRNFQFLRETKATELVEEGKRVVGVVAESAGVRREVRASLVVAADGRHSVLREKSGLPVQDFGAPIDVLWFRLSRKNSDRKNPLGRFGVGKILVMLDRGEFWQCAYVIPKGSDEALRQGGLEKFRRAIVDIEPNFADRVEEITSWDQVKLLTVRVDRLKQWYRSGLLIIGDAAHAMSPVGGVGINLAIQDAVATANQLARPLASGNYDLSDLQKIQRRRELPTKLTQRMQLLLHSQLIVSTLRLKTVPQMPLALKLVKNFPILRRVPAFLIGRGVRPEHVRL